MSPSPISTTRFRLSLRALMVAVVAAALLAGWAANTIHAQRRAIAAVRAAGGTILFDYQREVVGLVRGRPAFRTEPSAPTWLRRWLGDELFQRVEGVSFDRLTAPTAADLAVVATFDRLQTFTLFDSTQVGDGFRHLRSLNRLRDVLVFGPRVNDAVLSDLAGKPSLRSLNIYQATATDAGVARLATLPDLERLQVQECLYVTDAGMATLLTGLPKLRDFNMGYGPRSASATLAALARYHPDLERLNFSSVDLNDADLAALEGLNALNNISLQNTPVGVAGLVHLRPLKRLTTVMISGPNIVDDCLRELGGVTSLASLSIGSPRLTDAGLGHLARLPNLKKLRILSPAAGLTPEGIHALRRAVPTLGPVAIPPPARPRGVAPATAK